MAHCSPDKNCHFSKKNYKLLWGNAGRVISSRVIGCLKMWLEINSLIENDRLMNRRPFSRLLGRHRYRIILPPQISIFRTRWFQRCYIDNCMRPLLHQSTSQCFGSTWRLFDFVMKFTSSCCIFVQCKYDVAAHAAGANSVFLASVHYLKDIDVKQ